MPDDPDAARLAAELTTALAGTPRRGRPVGDGPPAAAAAPHGQIVPDAPREGPSWLEDALARATPVAQGGAFVAPLGDAARREVAARPPEGPLAGWTLAVKDLVAVAGLPLGAGSAVRDGAPPEPHDARVVADLRAAGATLVGTTALHELAIGVTGINAGKGTPRNPLDPARVPGGSSSGSAVAVATGAADLAVGTDTGGSVRIPAALCGVVGFKPTHGRLSTAGVHPLAPTLDHVGLLARRVTDVAHAARVLGIAAPAPPTGLRALRLGYVPRELEEADPEVAAAIAGALDRLSHAGATLVEAEPADAGLVFATSTTLLLAEAAAVHAADLAEVPERFGADVAARFRAGLALPAVALAAAHAARRALITTTRARLHGLDALVGPTVGVRAPLLAALADPADAAAAGARLVAHTRLANVCGLPAISLPAAPGVGLQLLAADDGALLAHATAVEGALIHT